MPSPTPPEPDEPTSYTKMSTAATSARGNVGDADLDAIGAHCQSPYCNQLDFLPFRCESCRGTFCLDHRTETAHKCPRAGEWARQRARQNQTASGSKPSVKPSILTHESQCASPQCKTLIDTPLVPGIGCDGCNRRYCLKHRLREDHDCSKLPPIGARVGRGDGGLSDALGKLKAWGAAKKAAATSSMASSSSSRQTASSTTQASNPQNTLHRIVSPFQSKKAKTKAAEITALNALKRSAKGDSKVPADKRIYVHLEAVAAASEGAAGARVPRADAFYSADWVVGRVLDMAARTLQVENVNNRAEEEARRLRVFWVEGGRLLDFGERLGAGSGSGSSTGAGVGSGDTLVLLRGVGAPVPDLIEA